MVVFEKNFLMLIIPNCFWNHVITYTNKFLHVFTQEKQWGLYQNKVNSSLAFIQRPGN